MICFPFSSIPSNSRKAYLWCPSVFIKEHHPAIGSADCGRSELWTWGSTFSNFVSKAHSRIGTPTTLYSGHVSCLESRVDIAKWRRWHGRDVMDTKETVLRWCSKAFLGKVWLRWSRNCWQKFLAWIRRWRKLMSSGWGQHFDIVWVCKFGCLGRIMNCSWRVCQLHPSKNLQNPQVCNVNSWVKEDATKQKGSCRLLVTLCKYIYIYIDVCKWI